MKAILEFNLPEDQDQFDLANKALDMGLILWEIMFNKKRELYELESAEEVIDKFYQWFNEELTERGINIDSLIK